MAKAKTAPALRLSQRDLNVLRAVAEGQQLATSQISALLFPSTKKASARLKQLVDGGLLGSSRKAWTFAKPSTENFYSLAKSGRETLRREEGRLVSAKTKAVTNIAHLAGINQLRVLLKHEVADTEHLDLQFSATWQLSLAPTVGGKSTAGRGLGRNLVNSIKPDAVFTLRNRNGVSLLFFVEIDMASEPVRRLGRGSSLLGKVERYASYFDSGEYRRDGVKLFGYTFRGFRVLLVTTKDSRLQHIRERIDQYGDTHFIWGSTFDHVESEGVLGKSWQVMASDDTGEYRSICGPYQCPSRHVSKGEKP